MRIGKLDGDFVVNPEEETLEELEMDLIVSGSDDAILMVECGADGVTEAEVLDALDIAHAEIKTLVARWRSCERRPARRRSRSRLPRSTRTLLEEIKTRLRRRSSTRRRRSPRSSRARTRSTAVEEEALAELAAGEGDEEADPEKAPEVTRAFAKLEKDVIRRRIAVDKKRPDGRAQDEIRPIETEVDIAPRVHGSALFTRGETQILS